MKIPPITEIPESSWEFELFFLSPFCSASSAAVRFLLCSQKFNKAPIEQVDQHIGNLDLAAMDQTGDVLQGALPIQQEQDRPIPPFHLTQNIRRHRNLSG